MNIKIEKGIPMPCPLNESNRRNMRYPWRDMAVGDSFVYRTAEQMIAGRVQSTTPHMAAKMASLRLSPITFRARKMPDGSYRIWRVQ